MTAQIVFLMVTFYVAHRIAHAIVTEMDSAAACDVFGVAVIALSASFYSFACDGASVGKSYFHFPDLPEPIEIDKRAFSERPPCL